MATIDVMTDKNKLTEIFEQSRDELRSFVLRITAAQDDTDDIIQDTYVKALEKLHTFKELSSLKTWIFSIATNLAKDYLRAKKRWPENVTDICREAALGNRDFLQNMMQVRMTSPQGDFEIREHIAFCFTCIGKSLPIEQQIALLLKEVYQFKVAEISEILDTTEAAVKHLLHNSRSKMIEIFDNRCSLIKKEGICHQCSELNGIFNPKQNFEEEKNKIRMARDAGHLDKERLFDLRTKIVAAIDPYNSGASELQLLHLQHNKQVIEEYLKKDD